MIRRALGLFVLFSIATILAETGVLAVLYQRGLATPQTVQNLLIVAHEVPVRELYEKLEQQAQPQKKEMVSYLEVREARMLASLDLDLREMSSDKGMLELQELGLLLDQERGRYTQIKEQFDQSWANLNKDASDSALRDLQRQIESLQPKAAKDQLLRILDSPDIPPDVALDQVVTVFKNLAIDKRKKIVAEFKDATAPRLQEVLKQIRLGMPEMDVLRKTRDKLQEFSSSN